MVRRFDAPPRWLLTAWIVAAVILVATAALCVPGDVIAGERPAFDFINGLPGSQGAERLVDLFMVLGTVPAAIVAVGAIVGATGRARTALSIGVAFVMVRVATEVLKDSVGRSRPPDLVAVEHLRSTDAGYGFPSGHTANAFVLAILIGLSFPRLRWPLLATAAAIGLARIYVGAHLPLDVVGGAAVGVLGTSIGWLVGRAVTGSAVPDTGAEDDAAHAR